MMSLPRARRFTATLFLLWWTLVRPSSAMEDAAQCMLEECSTSNLSNLSNNTAQSRYSISLSSQDYYQQQIITVTVRLNECPTFHTPTPSWYKLEAISQVTSTAVGRFHFLHRQSRESYLCSNNSVVVFSTCEPRPLDLPKAYNWTAPVTVNAGVICFRLITKTVIDEEEHCAQTEQCISPTPPPPDQEMEMDCYSGEESREQTAESREQTAESREQTAESNSIITGMNDEEVENQEDNNTVDTQQIARCMRKWNCTNARLITLCGSDGRTYNSRCEKRQKECISNIEINITHVGRPCTPPTTPPTTLPTTPPTTPPTNPPTTLSPPWCTNYRNELREQQSSWLPDCDCNGHYKPIQCTLNGRGVMECWCADAHFVGLGNNIPIECTDPESFNFVCS